MSNDPRPMRLDAYYYGFTATGEDAIDHILSAVAHAGKAYHHTDRWTDETYDGAEREPFLRGTTCVEWIQNAAIDAAAEVRRLRSTLPARPAAEIEIDRSPIISAAETYGRAHAALLEHEEEVRALATPALVPADLWSLLTEHADARDSYDTAFRRIHQAALNPSDSETGDEAEENMQAEMLRSGRANSAIAEWTRANRGGGK